MQTLLLSFLSAAWHGAQVEAPPRSYPAEYYHSFKERGENGPGLSLVGPEADRCVRFGPEGMRITLPAGFPKERPNTGIATGFAIRGDFEITVRYEILREPAPEETSRQTRFTLFVPLDRPDRKNRATHSRRVTKGGTDYFTWLVQVDEQTGEPRQQGNVFRTQAKAGRLRLVRSGAKLEYHSSEGAAGPFTLLQEYPFGTEDLQELRIVGSTGGPGAELDVRVHDLLIRAAALPNAPASLRNSGTRNWLIGLLIVGVVVAVLMFVVLRRRRRMAPITRTSTDTPCDRRPSMT